MPSSPSTKPKNFLSPARQLPVNAISPNAPIFAMTQHQYQAAVTDALLAEFGHLKSPAKACASVAESGRSTAKLWLSYRTTPHGMYEKRLRARLPNFDAAMRELEGKRDEMDPEFPRLLNQAFMQALRDDPRIARMIYERFMAPANTAAKEPT